MLQPTERFQYIPYVVPWWESANTEEPWPDDDSRILDYVNEEHGEDVQNVRPQLLDELELSQSPYSGINTACALETYTQAAGYSTHLYLGHREERLAANGTLQIVTAMEMALGKIASDEEKVNGVYLTGRNLPDGKLKRIMPIPTDYDHLAKRFDCEWGPTFLLIPPDSYDWPAMQGLKWVWASRHAKTYAQHDYIEVSSEYAEGFYSMLGILRNNTKLKPEDSKFVMDFTYASIDNGWTSFFTGSASGQGEITPAMKDDYDDMDFIVVADDPDQAEAAIAQLAEQQYGTLTKVPEVAYDTYAGKKIKGFFLFNQDGKKLIQLAIGKTMDEVCFRPDVIERNSGIWLNDCR